MDYWPHLVSSDKVSEVEKSGKSKQPAMQRGPCVAGNVPGTGHTKDGNSRGQGKGGEGSRVKVTLKKNLQRRAWFFLSREKREENDMQVKSNNCQQQWYIYKILGASVVQLVNVQYLYGSIFTKFWEIIIHLVIHFIVYQIVSLMTLFKWIYFSTLEKSCLGICSPSSVKQWISTTENTTQVFVFIGMTFS